MSNFLEKTKLQIFSQTAELLEEKSIEDIANMISFDEYRADVEEIQSAFADGKNNEASNLKKRLPALVSSGKFGNHLKAENLQDYYGIMTLDFDHLDTELEEIRSKVNDCPYTLMSYVSPSGNGLKVLVKSDATRDIHEKAYEQVLEYFQSLTGKELDRVNKNIARKSFLSYDPDCYLNNQPKTFHCLNDDEKSELSEMGREDSEKDTDRLLEDLIHFTERRFSYHNGNRNNFIYQLACNANRAGVQMRDIQPMILNKYDLDKNETKATISSAYKNHQYEFGKYARSARFALVEKSINQQSNFKISKEFTSPKIPEEVYGRLPDLLKQGFEKFTTARERDVFLTGSLVTLSACFPRVKGKYYKDIVYPNLNCVIAAPPASGKSALKHASKLVEPIHNEIVSKSKNELSDYESQMEQYKKKASEDSEKSNKSSKPKKPSFKTLLIPANSSSSAVIQKLQSNDGIGLICETEIDTLSSALSNEWGNYSDMIRKAFQHEKISFARKMNNDYIEIPEPKLSVALSGTFNQVPKLIKSVEDGLFSRMIFYVFKDVPVWRTVTPESHENQYVDEFEGVGFFINEKYQFINRKDFIFRLSPDQWKEINKTYSGLLKQHIAFYGIDIASTVVRLGLITYRIAMILSILRVDEKNLPDTYINCKDQDFETALQLSKVYLSHALFMLELLPNRPTSNVPENIRLFYDHLPENREFDRGEAVKFGETIGIKERTVGKYLNLLKDNQLIKQPLKWGPYKKVNLDS